MFKIRFRHETSYSYLKVRKFYYPKFSILFVIPNYKVILDNKSYKDIDLFSPQLDHKLWSRKSYCYWLYQIDLSKSEDGWYEEAHNTTTLSPLINCDLGKQEFLWMPSQLRKEPSLSPMFHNAWNNSRSSINV